MSKHRATGNPRGRPSKIPFDLGERILASFRRRMDPGTGLVRPLLRETGRELGVSRSTVAREMVNLRASGLVESVFVPNGRGSGAIYYRLRELLA